MADKEPDGKTAQTAAFTGRDNVWCRFREVTEENVAQAVAEALPFFQKNMAQIDYLWRYYEGDQPILRRIKEIRPEICNRVVENHAQEITVFKVGYQLAEPVQYVSRPGDEDDDCMGSAKRIKRLNTLMEADEKESDDRDLFEWMAVCGIGFRYVTTPDEGEDCAAPFASYVLDPRTTFVAKSREYHHRPLMAVMVCLDEDDREFYNVWTDREYFRVQAGQVVESKDNPLGVCIVEYELNSARMGAFEPVLPLLDAVNVLESNRIDGDEQTVQSLMKFINCDITEVEFAKMLELGAVKVRSVDGAQGDVDFITNELDQSQTQVCKEDLYRAIANIAGMPNLYGSSGSTSDTGTAVLLRDGWTLAESHAKGYEKKWKQAERRFLNLVLRVCDMAKGVELGLETTDIALSFNRRNYESGLVRAQMLTTMLSTDQIDPKLAFQSCGLFTDPEAAYLMSKAHFARREQVKMDKALEIAGAQKAENEVEAANDGSNEYNDKVRLDAAIDRQTKQSAARG